MTRASCSTPPRPAFRPGASTATPSPGRSRRRPSLVRRHLGPLDLVVYSIASPRRLDPATGTLHSSVIKPIGRPYIARTVDFQSGEITR